MDLKNLLKPNLKKIILFFVLYAIIHLPALLHIVMSGIVLGIESIIMIISSTAEGFFSGSRILYSGPFSKVSPFLLVFLCYIISCWTVRGLSRSVLNGKSRNWKVIIISSVILQFIFMGFLGRPIFYSMSQFKNYDISMVAKSTQIVFLCNLIDDYNEREYCIRYIAKEKQKPSLCSKINRGSNRDKCHASTGSCSEVDYVPTKNSCYLAVAVREKDASICEMAGSSRDLCLIDVARETKDMSICDNKVAEWLKEKCISEVIFIRQRFGSPASDVEYCRMLKSDESARNNCLTEVAKGTDNIALCQEVTNDNDASHLKDKDRKDYCYYYFAIYSDKHKGDRSICIKIESKYWRTRCIEEVAEQ